ncbi:importin-11 isoform X5 [Pan troglodytes]|uniref:importin-11 isoform X5 n=2 Tax=Pan troglodytes TaxID=9598 RepID=UPI003013D510
MAPDLTFGISAESGPRGPGRQGGPKRASVRKPPRGDRRHAPPAPLWPKRRRGKGPPPPVRSELLLQKKGGPWSPLTAGNWSHRGRKAEPREPTDPRRHRATEDRNMELEPLSQPGLDKKVSMDLNSASTVVLQVLTQATSQDTAVLKPAEEQLKQWETQPGFYSVLLNIFTNHTLDINVRWLAVLYFKHGIDRYWRRVAPHALSEEEKTTLRAGLITNFNEPINQIATQIAVLIAKVARLDCPRQWPELIPTLIESVKVQDDLRQHRALLTFYHVTKTLASKRLAADRKLFYDLASGIYNFACSLWNHHTDTFLQQVSSGNEAAILSSLERTLLSLKVLRKLTVNGFVEPHKNMEVMGFLHGIFERLKQFLECSRSIGTDNVCRDRLEKTIILFTKVLLDFLDQHPFSFTPLIQRSLEFSVSYVFTEVGEGVTFERFIVQCMNLIKMIVKNYAYKPSKNFEDSSPETLEAHKIKMAFFTYPTLTEICRRLVSHYFLLTEEELTMWEEDPEGFTVEETGGDSWKYSLRPCTEVLFIDIFHEYNQTLTPVLLEMMQRLQGPTNVEDMNALLIKDAVYNAVGLAAYELFDSVDFDQWFKNQLLPELQVIHNRYKPLRRRVIWLIGQWISVKFKSDLRPMLYEAICNLLQDQDLVVRIETATTLKLTVDDFEFRTDQFLPYLETMFTLLFQLLQQVTECDTKMHVLHVLSCVIERVNMQIRPYVGCLVQYLPLLWKQSEEHNMLRCAILTTLIHLVQVVENALKVNPILGPQMFQPILPYVFKGIIEGERYPVVMSTYLGVMGRVLLQNTSFFSSLLNEMAHKFNQEMDQLLGNMIEMWVDRMDNITQPERRKLSALALLSLLPSDNSVIQDKFCGIINISVEGLHDVMTEDPETGTYKDCMLMSHLEEPKVTEDEEPPTEQDKRKKMLALKDPVHTVSLQQFIYEKLKAQQEMLGEQGFQSLMETVDTEIVTQLQEFLQGF